MIRGKRRRRPAGETHPPTLGSVGVHPHAPGSDVMRTVAVGGFNNVPPTARRCDRPEGNRRSSTRGGLPAGVWRAAAPPIQGRVGKAEPAAMPRRRGDAATRRWGLWRRCLPIRPVFLRLTLTFFREHWPCCPRGPCRCVRARPSVSFDRQVARHAPCRAGCARDPRTGTSRPFTCLLQRLIH